MNYQTQLRGEYFFRGRGRHVFQGRPTTPFSNSQGYHQKEEFWCETCDRAFRSQILLDNHNKEHMKCSIDGCQFVAHPKVVTKHIEMQHSTGLYNRIGNLNDPEAIQKWREERKKRYPTKENITKKQIALKEKVNRGEKMGLQKMRHNTGPHSKQQGKINKNTKREQHKRKLVDCTKRNKKMKKPEPEVMIPAEHRKLKPFAGIQNVIFSDDESRDETADITFHIEDEFELETGTTSQDTREQNVAVCGALSSLIMNYDSSEDEHVAKEVKYIDTTKTTRIVDTVSVGDDFLKDHSILPKSMSLDSAVQTDVILKKSTVEVATPSRNNTALNSKTDKDKNKDESEDSGPEEIHSQKPADVAHNLADVNSVQITSNKRRDKTHNSKRFLVRKTKLPSTLLVKLLSNEIRHERNVILQCVRHIVKNNYFKRENDP